MVRALVGNCKVKSNGPLTRKGAVIIARQRQLLNIHDLGLGVVCAYCTCRCTLKMLEQKEVLRMQLSYLSLWEYSLQELLVEKIVPKESVATYVHDEEGLLPTMMFDI